MSKSKRWKSGESFNDLKYAQETIKSANGGRGLGGKHEGDRERESVCVIE